MPKSTITGYTKGTSLPTAGNVQKIADYFNVAKSELDLRFKDDIEQTQKNKEQKGIKIPVLGEVAAGVPISAVEDILDYEEISEDMARTGDFFALQIKGDSMQPKMDDGDVVIVKQQSDVNSGDTAIVLVNSDTATCKKIQKHENGIMLISTNPNYPAKFFSNKEVKELPVTILGKVVELRAKF
ncbi:hypothetical protein IR059_00800 [Gemella sp. GL1.1]|nr:hypothetical protein [Gemella sp. GL1.1]MBF0747149.1 hypothetical protein [Gemella sp. 19428wG2_WT2a]NYS27107.1 hypothetical protein [Gemella sp. GL1]